MNTFLRAAGIATTSVVLLGTQIHADVAPASPDGVSPYRFDQWHARASDYFMRMVRTLDHWIGDESLDEDNLDSRLRLSVGTRWIGREGLGVNQRVSARIVLPAFEQRLQILIDQDAETETSDERRLGVFDREDLRPVPGIRYILHADEKRRLHLDGRLRFRSGPQPVARLRGRLTAPFHPWELRLSHAFRYVVRDGWETDSEMRWSRLFDPLGLFRLSSRLQWQEIEPGLLPSQTLGIYKTLWPYGIGWLQIKGDWPEVPHTHTTVYTLESGIRTAFLRPWSFVEFGTGLFFPQTENYRETPFVRLRMEILFGGY